MVVFLDDLTLVVMLAFSCVQFLAALNQAKMLRPDLFEFTSLEQRFHKQSRALPADHVTSGLVL
jgi:hypothetical protein